MLHTFIGLVHVFVFSVVTDERLGLRNNRLKFKI